MDQVLVKVTLTLPWARRRLVSYDYAISSTIFKDSLIPLPRDREIIQWSHCEAQAQRDRRDRLAKHIATMIADSLLHYVEQQDTVNGYSKENVQC